MAVLAKLIIGLMVGGLIFSFSSPAVKAAEETGCFWSNTRDSTCTLTFPDGAYIPADRSSCQADQYPGQGISVCCCPKTLSTTYKPKHVVITTVVIGFAIITTLVLLLKKND